LEGAGIRRLEGEHRVRIQLNRVHTLLIRVRTQLVVRTQLTVIVERREDLQDVAKLDLWRFPIVPVEMMEEGIDC